MLLTSFLLEEELRESREYSCLMAHMPREFADHIRHLTRQIDRREIVKPAFEPGEQPHVTVLYGLHTKNPAEVHQAVKSSNPPPSAEVEVGKLGVFRTSKFDVLKFDVKSPDLERLHHQVKKLPNSFSFGSYEPHVTVAYLKRGTADKYAAWLDSALQGRRVRVGSLVFSTPEKHVSVIPLSHSPVGESVHLLATWGMDPYKVLEMTTAGAVGLQPVRSLGFIRPIEPQGKLAKRSRANQP